MAGKVTQKDIERINDLYLELGTYAAVAREVGFSASTVKRYVIPGYQKVSIPIDRIPVSLPPIETIEVPAALTEWLKLSDREIDEIAIFKRNEVSV